MHFWEGLGEKKRTDRNMVGVWRGQEDRGGERSNTEERIGGRMNELLGNFSGHTVRSHFRSQFQLFFSGRNFRL